MKFLFILVANLFTEGGTLMMSLNLIWLLLSVFFLIKGFMNLNNDKSKSKKMLKQLVKKAMKQNRKPICSMTIENIGSQKAIEGAGFYCSNIIFDINLI